MTKKLDDKILEAISGVIQGNKNSARVLYLHFHKAIHRYCYFLSKSESLADDITQETFISAFRNLHTLKDRNLFSSWLYSIAMRKYIDHRRPKKNQEHHNVDDHQLKSGDTYKVDYTQTIHVALDQLSTLQKNALLLIDVEENSYEEAAKILNINIDLMKSQLRMARRNFMNYCETNGIEFTGFNVIPVSNDDNKESA